MKILILLLATLAFSNLRAEIELYTSESNRPISTQDIYSVLKEITEQNPDKNIVYYVHGRKREVSVEFERMKAIEKNYNVKVILFHWDSYDTLLSRPVENAKTASKNLFETFIEIARFKQDFKPFFERNSITLLCHSMGNLILKDTIEEYFVSNESKDFIFDTFVSTGADVPMNQSDKWLSKINFIKNKYVLMNNRDIVLLFSYMLDIRNQLPLTYRLGLGFDNLQTKYVGTKKRMPADVNFIDLSDLLSIEHAYVVSKNEKISSLMNYLLNNKSFDNFNNLNGKMYLNQDNKMKNLFKAK